MQSSDMDSIVSMKSVVEYVRCRSHKAGYEEYIRQFPSLLRLDIQPYYFA